MTAPGSALSLFEAIDTGDADQVRAALAAGESPSRRDDDDWSPLDRAAGAGAVAVIRVLLSAGADPADTGREQRTAYRIALAAGRVEAARVLRDALEAADPTSAADHQWRPYCRAYTVGRLRTFPGWPADAADLGDADVVFVHDDFTVTREMWPGEGILLDEVTDEWRTYCAEQLEFRVPDDFDLVPGQKSGVI